MCAYLAQSVELSAVNRSVVGSSPTVGATFGELEKRLNSHAFHACIHGFESRIRHQSTLYTNTEIYCDGKLLGITIDLKPYLAKIRALSDRKKNH